MYLTNLYLERFGERSDLRVDGLAEGLNVVFAPPGAGKTTVVQFLQTMFGGFDSSLRDRYATRGWGGTVSLQVDRACYSISRYDDGGRDDRLAVERPDEAVVERRQVHRLLSDLNHALLRHAVIVDFSRRPELAELLRQISSCGFLPSADFQRSDENQVRDGSLTEGEQHVTVLRREIANIERSLSELGQRRKELQLQLKAASHSLIPSDAQPGDVRLLERQLRRWKRTLRDVLRYKKLAAEKYAARKHGDLNQTAVDASSLLVSVEDMTGQLRRLLERTEPQESQNGSANQLRGQISGALDQLHRDVRNVAYAVEQDQVRRDAREALIARDHLARCEVELRHAIRWLTWRHRQLLERRAPETALKQGDVEKLPVVFAENHPTKRALIQEINALGQEVARLADVRLKWLAEVDEWELDMAERRSKVNPIADSWTPIVRDASEFLRRLTGNDDLRVQVSDKFEAWIENQTGVRTRYDQLDQGMRDQLYLAFCLAVAMANQRWGRQIPLVLNGVFTHFPSENVRRALEFLIAFSRGQQVICMTRHEHVVSVARLLNIPVRSLGFPELPAMNTSNRERHSKLHSPVQTIPTENIRLVSPHVSSVMWAADELSQRYGYPGHRSTTDLVNAANTLEGTTHEFANSAPVPATDPLTIGGTSYCLGEHDPIEKTPSLDPTNAQRLRKIGLLRVGDLLRVPTADVAYDLRHTGVSVDMIESWRAQARLMCSVPGLRTYDARILVACGIRDPEQLIQMQPGALRIRVKEFASSAEGQAILMSGTEFELSRVTDWINTARELRRASVATQDTAPPAKHRVSRRREFRRREHRNVTQPTVDSSSALVSRGGKSNSKATVVQRSYDAAVHPHYIRLTDSVAAIPWLGSSVVKRLQKIGISTVAIFLDTPPDVVAEKLKLSRVRLETIQRWQSQLKLVCAIPHLRFQDARLLYSLGITSNERLAAWVPAELWQKMANFCQSPKGRRLLGNCRVAEQDQISAWITSARQYHSRRAA